ncbi:MAG TPA: MFS transporter, partial [Gaiellaceae bacterium]|nr:MFS transporter [Gaiellaceae bacterium]
IGSILGTFAYFVALGVYAFAHGGTGAVALVSVLQMIPAGVLAPFLATLADRLPRRLVMVVSDLVRAALMAAAAGVIATGGPAWIVYALVTATSIAGTAFSPAKAALLPLLARTPAELSAANAASTTIVGAGGFIGPALGGFLLAATNAEVVFAVNALSFLWSAALVLSLRVERQEPEPAEERHDEASGEAGVRALTAGLRVIARSRDLTLLVALFTAQTLVAGALEVLVVVTALKLLHGGPTEVGAFDAAIGVGGLLGSFVALALATRNRLAADFGLGLALFGAMAAIGVAPHLVTGLIALGVLGIGNSLVDIAALTILQRTVPNDVLGRVLGLLDGLLLGSIGVGALAIPLLVGAFGVRASLIVVGAFPVVLVALTWPRLRRLDATARAPELVELLRGVEILAPLPPVRLERLAASLVPVRLPAGATVIREGEEGDRFYVVGEGEVEIQGRTFGPGSSFGEIALLRDVPRTATVTAATDVLLHALERDDFLAAVTAHEPSTAAADAVIARRLGGLRREAAGAGGAELTTEAGAA